MSVPDTNTESFRRSLRRTGGFLYRHSASLVIVSVCWFVGSLPIVTFGPATLGAYAAIRSLQNHGQLRSREVRRTLRRHGLSATLLGIVPIILAVFTATYFYWYVTTDATQYVVLSIVGLYLFSFLSLVLSATFVRLSDGSAFVEAITDSYVWVIRNPVLSMMTLVVSGVVLLIGVVSVVGLIVIVPSILFSFHEEVVRNSPISSTSEPNQ